MDTLSSPIATVPSSRGAQKSVNTREVKGGYIIGLNYANYNHEEVIATDSEKVVEIIKGFLNTK